jgi:hypothetical protein
MTRRAARTALSAAIIVLLMALPNTSGPTEAEPPRVRAMWVWKTDALLSDAAGRKAFLRQARMLRLTDVYLFLRAADYADREAALKNLLSALQQIGVRAWGMEGWRGYFSDVEGPAGLYAAVDALIFYNKRNDVHFAGFHSDVEPQDGQGEGEARFVNGVAQRELGPEQLASRDGILAEWLGIHEMLLAKTRAGHVGYSAALPSWIDEYMGEPMQATFRGERKPLIEHLLPLVPQAVIMSYSTKPAAVIAKIEGELRAAGAGGSRIVLGVETHGGAGKAVSYADTPPRNRRAAVLGDLEFIDEQLAAQPAYLGWSIHDWEGWAALPP